MSLSRFPNSASPSIYAIARCRQFREASRHIISTAVSLPAAGGCVHSETPSCTEVLHNIINVGCNCCLGLLVAFCPRVPFVLDVL